MGKQKRKSKGRAREQDFEMEEKAISPGQLKKLQIMCTQVGMEEISAVCDMVREELDIIIKHPREIPFDNVPMIFAILESGKYGNCQGGFSGGGDRLDKSRGVTATRQTYYGR